MSILRRHNGTYVVRWSEGRRKRGRTFDRRSDAERFESEIKRRKQLGGIVVLPERVSLPELHHRYVQHLRDLGRERNTLDGYAAMWKHLERELGSIEVREITPATVEALGPRMIRSAVGPTSASKALSFLSSMLNRAVVWGYIERNPCEHAQRPRTTRTRPIVALSPAQVEAIREQMKLRDRTLVSVMALSGLRPGEALALSWDSVRDRNTIHVTRSVAHGQLKSTKTGQTRSVAVIPSLARDLAEWDLASGRPLGGSLVFPNGRGEPWTDAKFRNWRSRIFEPAATKAGLKNVTPYSLRHTRASMLLASGVSLPDAAAQLGHGVQVLASTYAHVIAEYRGRPPIDVEAEVQSARRQYQAA